MRADDIVDLVAAAYAPAEHDGAWLSGLVAAGACLDRGGGVAAFAFDVEPTRVRASRAKGGASLSRSVRARLLERRAPVTVGDDLLAIRAQTADGRGCCIAVPLAGARVRASERRVYARLADQLAAALRWRARVLAADDVLAAAEDALGAATHDELRATLARAAHVLRRTTQSVSWRILAREGWTLVDQFAHAGGHVLVAASESPVRDVERLTVRERAAIELAERGIPTSLVARALDVSESTVRVLLMRVTRKLGVRSRGQAIARYRAEGPFTTSRKRG